MNQNSNTRVFSLFISILAMLAVVKIGWVAISYLYLPGKGVTLRSKQVKNALHYRYKFASDVALPKVEPEAKPAKEAPSLKDIRLVGIYSSADGCIVTLIKKGKSHILSNGDEIDGFVLKKASAKEAFFEKDSKEYVLKLFEEKRNSSSSIQSPNSNDQEVRATKPGGDESISTRDGIRQVPRSILKTYTGDINRAMRDIGLRPIHRDGRMQGYKVRFIRKGSPFSQLGLERGDIIKAINGEEIVDFAGPMALLRNADTIEGLTITVIRKNEEKELEYEVK